MYGNGRLCRKYLFYLASTALRIVEFSETAYK